ncbi:type I-E CRISPR-associated protein Cas6/Cse3/CasE [Streptomyces sp. NPDC020883]|uniref:type I-E CRISPR-associated protein Cas6/Cse3/CasE n=1 Tax=Streptomyces sp. NPDC020883 TaxID=3365099 RepID=UPI0037BD0395
MTTPRTAQFIAQHALLDLDLNHPLITRSLLDPHEMHRTVMAAFRHWVPEGTPDARAQMGVLHTYATNLKTSTLTLIVQSRVPGDWTMLPRNAFTATPEISNIHVPVTEGERHRFRVVVNPARYTPGRQRTHNQPGNATPHRALEWFTARLQQEGQPDYNRWPRIGADADPSELNARTLSTLTSHTSHAGMRVNRAEITGNLTVTDPPAYVRTLTQGLGRSRAYGCGLLLTQRAPLPAGAKIAKDTQSLC